MKKYFVIIALSLLAGMNSCKKHKTYPKVPSPDWKIDQTGKYPVSMTAVVQVPEDLLPYVQQADKIGAFAGEECRGLGTLVQAGSAQVFFILIHGTASEQARISFKYYSSWQSNMYETDASFDFTVDGNYGTVDAPEVLELRHAK